MAWKLGHLPVVPQRGDSETVGRFALRASSIQLAYCLLSCMPSETQGRDSAEAYSNKVWLKTSFAVHYQTWQFSQHSRLSRAGKKGV